MANKIKWTASVVLIFVIVLATNLIDKNSFDRVRDVVTNIYEDRVVASDIIFSITLRIQEKEMALALSDSTFMTNRNDKSNEEIAALVDQFKETKLTDDEEKILGRLNKDFDKLKRLEQKYMSDNGSNKNAVFHTIDDIIQNLYALSKVQLEEGRRKMKLGEQTFETVDLFSRIEIIFLVIIAVLIQIIILYKPKE